jgi:hypothetical protein
MKKVVYIILMQRLGADPLFRKKKLADVTQV